MIPYRSLVPPLSGIVFGEDLNENRGDLSINNTNPAQVNGDIAVLSNDSDEFTESKVGTTEDDNPPIYINDADLSIEYATSIEIRGCPFDKLYRETIWDKSAGSGGLRRVRQGATFCEPDRTTTQPQGLAYLSRARARAGFC